MKGWEKLMQHGVDVNILCTVHAANADHPTEVYHFFRDELKAAVHAVHPDRGAGYPGNPAPGQPGLG